jgi:hypothetical protein
VVARLKFVNELLPSFPFTWYSVEFIYVRRMESFLFVNQTHYYFVTVLLKVTNKAHSRCCESHAKFERPPKLELRSCVRKNYSASRLRKRVRGCWGAQDPRQCSTPRTLRHPHPSPEDRILVKAAGQHCRLTSCRASNLLELSIRPPHQRCECVDHFSPYMHSQLNSNDKNATNNK